MPTSRTPTVATAVLIASGLFGAGTAAAQEAENTFIYSNSVADIQQATTVNPGRIHITANFSVATADYFRGAFDDVPSDLDQIAYGPDLSVAFELWRDRPWPVPELSLSLGTQNNLAEQVQPTDASLEDWYESNNFAALTVRFGQDWLGQLTYTIYGSPNDVSGTAYQIALAGSYRGQNLIGGLKPQLKLAVPTDSGDGVYTELVAGPGFTLFEDGSYPLSLSAPATLGIGVDDYYGAGSGTTGFVGLSLIGGVPLAFIPEDYGSWTFKAGVNLLLRDQAIVDRGKPFDDAGNFVPIGTISIGAAY
jgi:hypothetical protein